MDLKHASLCDLVVPSSFKVEIEGLGVFESNGDGNLQSALVSAYCKLSGNDNRGDAYRIIVGGGKITHYKEGEFLKLSVDPSKKLS